MTSAIIIESAPAKRRLDPRQSAPRSLIPVEAGQPSALQWIISALQAKGISDITYVGGYHIEKVIQSFPEMSFRYLSGKEREGELSALLNCEEPVGACLILRATTVLMPDALEKMVSAGISAGVYQNAGVPTPVGVYGFDGAGVRSLYETARELICRQEHATIDEALALLSVRTVELDGLAAPVADKSAVAAMIFRGKARTLEHFAPLSKEGRVLALERFTAAQWRSKKEGVLEKLYSQFGNIHVVVRSSTVSEDSLNTSAAGQFLSILDVDTRDTTALRQAIEDVIASYAGGGRECHPDDEVLVQPYVRDLQASGVLLTRDPQHGAPYFVLNVDKESGRSDLVTSGGEGRIETHYVSWGAEKYIALDDHYTQVLAAGRELVALSHLDSLDIEFGLDKEGVCHLFQARPLACVETPAVDSDDDILDVIDNVYEFLKEAARPRPGVLGGGNLFGNMSDWNPAEMIGAYPRPLALSLYQALIGEYAWAESRARLGYRSMTAHPLILSLAGRPYVDIRASLNSLLPADLESNIGAQWIDYCLDKLRTDPPLHDKIEFELAVTCLTPEWKKHEKWLCEAGLDQRARTQFQHCLRRLTSAIIKGQVEPAARQFEAVRRLAIRRGEIMASSSGNLSGLGRRLRQLMRDCVNLGLLPFSIMARYAFIAMSMLKGLRAVGAVDPDLYDRFLRAVPTVSGQLAMDRERLGRGEINLEEMVALYGHLRPHSYDITSGNYASRPDHYFKSIGASLAYPVHPAETPLEVLMLRKAEIETALTEVGFDIDVKTLSEFIAEAISGREQLKFEFMKSIDAILETIATIGSCIDVGREALSFVPVWEFTRLEANSASRVMQSHTERISGQNEKQWLLSKALRLPDLLTRAEDVYAHRLESWRPNFITRKCVVAAPVVVSNSSDSVDLEGMIVVISAADPGFDWIFGHPIAGLVTQYGGVASHMAIRAAEFGLPAAIGCGEVLFNRLSCAKQVELDCEHHRIGFLA